MWVFAACNPCLANSSYIHGLVQLLELDSRSSYRIDVEVTNNVTESMRRMLESESPDVDFNSALVHSYTICIKNSFFFMSMCDSFGGDHCQNFFHDGNFYYLLDTGNSQIYASRKLDGLISEPTFAPYVRKVLSGEFREVGEENRAATGIHGFVKATDPHTRTLLDSIDENVRFSVGFNDEKADEFSSDIVFEIKRERFQNEESTSVEIVFSIKKLVDEIDDSIFIPHGFGDKRLYLDESGPLFVRDFLPSAKTLEKIMSSDTLIQINGVEAEKRPSAVTGNKYRANDSCHKCL